MRDAGRGAAGVEPDARRSFYHSQLSQLAWAINSIDKRKMTKQGMENHMLDIVEQIDQIDTRKDAELRKKKLQLIRKIEGVLRNVDVSSSSSSDSSRSPSSRAPRRRAKRSASPPRKKRARDDDGASEKEEA